MKKYAIVGPARVGKTTFAYQLAEKIMTTRPGVRVHVLPEITLLKSTYNLDLWQSQYSLIFSQLSLELEVQASEYELRTPDIFITDRTVIDSLMYLIEIAPVDAFLDKTIDLCIEYMNTFDRVLYIRNPLFHIQSGHNPENEIRTTFMEKALKTIRTDVVDVYDLYNECKNIKKRLLNRIGTTLYNDYKYE